MAAFLITLNLHVWLAAAAILFAFQNTFFGGEPQNMRLVSGAAYLK